VINGDLPWIDDVGRDSDLHDSDLESKISEVLHPRWIWIAWSDEQSTACNPYLKIVVSSHIEGTEDFSILK
jgi:hypothetical protein